MTKTSLPVLAILAAFAAQACAAPTADESSSEETTPGAEMESAADESEASKLSGAFGNRSEATTLAGVGSVELGEMKAGHDQPAQLFVKSRNLTLDVAAYDFGLEGARSDVTGATRDIAPATLAPLSVVVIPKPGSRTLAQDALTRDSIGEIVLSQYDAAGKLVEVARFDEASVIAANASAGGDVPVESYAFSMKTMRISKDGNWVKVDAATGVATTSSASLCNGTLGAFTQASQSSTPIAKGSTRIDALSVSVSSDEYYRARLDEISFSAPLELGGLCSVVYAARGTKIPAVRLGVGVAYTGTLPRESTTWEACLANVQAVRFSTRWDGTTEAVQLSAAGLVRTDRTWSTATTTPKEVTNGWSFATNSKIASCGEVK